MGVTARELTVIQASLSEQIMNIRRDIIEHRTEDDRKFDDLYSTLYRGKDNFSDRVSKMERSVSFMCGLLRWFTIIGTTILASGVIWVVSEAWRVREYVAQHSQPPTIEMPKK